jgi:hypothetical protein
MSQSHRSAHLLDCLALTPLGAMLTNDFGVKT